MKSEEGRSGNGKEEGKARWIEGSERAVREEGGGYLSALLPHHSLFLPRFLANMFKG